MAEDRHDVADRSIKHAAEDAAGSVKGAAVDVKDFCCRRSARLTPQPVIRKTLL